MFAQEPADPETDAVPHNGADSSGPPTPETALRCPRFTTGSILFGLLVYLGLLGFNNWGYLTQPPLANRWLPADTTLVFADRELAFEGIRERLAEPLRTLSRSLPYGSSHADYAHLALEESEAHGLAGSGSTADPRVLLALAVLTAETGQPHEARKRFDLLEQRQELRTDAERIRNAYADPPRPVSNADGHETASKLSGNWFYGMLMARFADSRGDRIDAEEWREFAVDELFERRGGMHLLSFLGCVLFIGGVIGLLLRRRWPAGGQRLPVCWSMREGLGIFVWSGAIGQALAVLVWVVTLQFPPMELAYYLFSVVIFLPTVALAYWCLCRSDGLRMNELFGLRPSVPLMWATLVLLLVDSVTQFILIAVIETRGPLPSVIEGLDEEIIWGTTGRRLLRMVDGTLGAGIFEELVFRGVLFLALRRKCGFILAALISSLAFAGIHFQYGWVGLLSVGLFGFIQAWSVERTQSLLPAILAHITTNFFIFGWQWLLYT